MAFKYNKEDVMLLLFRIQWMYLLNRFGKEGFQLDLYLKVVNKVAKQANGMIY